MSELSKTKQKQIQDELPKKRRIREANRSYVSKILHTLATEGILETSDPSSMEILQSNVAMLKEKADSLKNLDSRI